MDSEKKVLVKEFTRDASVLAFEMYYEGEALYSDGVLDWSVGYFVLHGVDGTVRVYYQKEDLEKGRSSIAIKGREISFLKELYGRFEVGLEELEEIWESKSHFNGVDEMLRSFDKGARIWGGLSFAYVIPLELDSSEFKEHRDLSLKARARGESLFEKSDAIFQRTLRFLYPNLGDLVKYISVAELREGEVPSREVLEKRSKGFVWYNGDFQSVESFDVFLDKEKFLVEGSEVDDVLEIKGNAAFLGDVKGRVRKIMNKSAIGSLEVGEVLVTSMTTPDFLPAMKKASAFVTDEGGITCHAAIVAREMRKPCIIGTKVATEVLQTGDLVKVDAKAGVVRVLEKA